MIFKDRKDAALKLLNLLGKYKNKNALILGIPRGAMPMARILAQGLQGELNAVLVHKIPAPFQEELAVASIGLSGNIHRLGLIESLDISEAYIEKEGQRQLEILKGRQKKFNLPALHCQNRIVIIVDDGIATGATALGAIDEVRLQNPAKLILAAAVVAKDTANKIRRLVDEFIVLAEPSTFSSVSQFFDDFSQVTDDEVVEIIKGFNTIKKAKPEIHP